MLSKYFDNLDSSIALPTILVVGCGSVGESVVKTFVDSAPHGSTSIYVTDSDKERARKLSEYRLSSITPIKWRYAHDTPDDVDIIVVAVDRSSEEKVIDRLALAKKPFITMSDDASTFDAYEEYEEEFFGSKTFGILGAGLVPGISEVIAKFYSHRFDSILDISVDRMGFVSSASLDSLKNARKESPLCVRDGMISDSRRDAGETMTWFPNPIDYRECQSVATGVIPLLKEFPEVHNLTVRFAEPRLPTFTERVKNIALKIPLTTTKACVRVEIHGLKSGEIKTEIYALYGDALEIITQTCVMATVELFNNQEIYSSSSPFISSSQIVDGSKLLNSLHDSGVSILRFDGDIN